MDVAARCGADAGDATRQPQTDPIFQMIGVDDVEPMAIDDVVYGDPSPLEATAGRSGGRTSRDGERYTGYWAIKCQVTTHAKGGWTGSQQVPIFYLHEKVQGVVSEEHAALIARDVVDPLGLLADEDIHVTAVKL